MDDTITLSVGDDDVSDVIDLAPNVARELLTETMGNIQSNNRQGRDTFTVVSGVLQSVVVKNHDQLDAIESRANSGIFATPIASPTTQSGTTT